MRSKAAKILVVVIALCGAWVLAPGGVRQRWTSVSPAAPAAQQPAPVSFERDIKPIFAARCLACHNEKKQSGGLRLDSKASALRAVVAGSAAQSRLYQRITATSDDERMPPVGERLGAAEVALLKAWIDAGAECPEMGAADSASKKAATDSYPRARAGDDARQGSRPRHALAAAVPAVTL